MRPFSIRLFAPAGDPEGVLVASRDDWPGRAVIFPRQLVGEVKGRKEYAQPGVYILVSAKKMYVGEGDPVGDRIDDHVKKKDFWRRGVFFTAEGGRLNKAHVQHLESRLIALAKNVNRVEMDNRNHPTVPGLSEEEHAFAENFLHQMLLTLPLLGFWQFAVEDDDDEESVGAIETNDGDVAEAATNPSKRAALYASLPQGLQFTLTHKGAFAKAEVSDGGVQVKQGSTVVNPPSERFELDSPAYANLRRQLVDSGVLAPVNGQLAFVKDQFFSSGSSAAAVVRGTHSNGDWWRHEGGKNLGDYIRERKGKVQLSV